MNWIACDTETFTFVDGEKISQESLERWSLTHEEAYIREHASVKVWAWLVYGKDGFRNFETFEEFCQYLIDEKIEQAWWFNAKFDFAEIDWHVLSDPEKWTHATEKDHPDGWWWDDLHGNQGERYSFTVGLGGVFCKMYDVVNFFKTSLEKMLKAFDVRDEHGEKIGKLTMDYQTGGNTDYLINDVKGLYFAVKAIDEKMTAIFEKPFLSSKPYAITASGLAKKIFLEVFYAPNVPSYQKRKMVYQRVHASSLEKDVFWRKGNLYKGGLVIVNPFKCGKMINEQSIRIDDNSMYPAMTEKMPEIVGNPVVSRAQPWEGAVEVIDLQAVCLHLKEGMIPCFSDPRKNKMTAHFEKICEAGEHFFIFREELEELAHWYDIDYDGLSVFFKTKDNPAYGDYVQTFYRLKREAKERGDRIQQDFAKMLLNGLGGKFAENPIKDRTERILKDGACRLDNLGEEICASAMLDVRQGALMTSMARVFLLSTARKACKNVAEQLYYTDTDSIHGAFDLTAVDVDEYRLGAWKKEADITAAKFLAPKTYLELEKDGTLSVHAKGCPQKALDALFQIDEKGRSRLSIEEIDRLFSPGQTINALHAMNIKGGKALFLRPKHICKPENAFVGKDFLFEA